MKLGKRVLLGVAVPTARANRTRERERAGIRGHAAGLRTVALLAEEEEGRLAAAEHHSRLQAAEKPVVAALGAVALALVATAAGGEAGEVGTADAAGELAQMTAPMAVAEAVTAGQMPDTVEEWAAALREVAVVVVAVEEEGRLAAAEHHSKLHPNPLEETRLAAGEDHSKLHNNPPRRPYLKASVPLTTRYENGFHVQDRKSLERPWRGRSRHRGLVRGPRCDCRAATSLPFPSPSVRRRL